MYKLLSLIFGFLFFFVLVAQESSQTISHEELEQLWRERLIDMGLEDDVLEYVLKEELKIQKKVIKEKEDKQDEKTNELHIKEAKKFIKSTKILKGYADGYMDKLTRNWDYWWYQGKEARKETLIELRDTLENKEIQERKKKSRRTFDKLTHELKSYWQKKGLRQKEYARFNFRISWDTLINTPERLYQKEKSTVKLDLKRNGFDPSALKIFFKHVDGLFNQ